jgi:DNA-directed RNA polymerase subunit RPC12/RpoP
MKFPTKTCPRCGAGIRENDARCPYCGAAILLSQAKPTPQAISPAAAPPPLPTQDNLPPELACLQAPKPSQPLEASGCTLFFFLVWTLFSAMFLVLGVGTYIRDSSAYHRLSREGITAAAAITNLDFDSGDDSIRYYVYYHFQASIQGDTARFQGSDEVSGAFFSRLEMGQTIEVRYWLADPSLSAVKAELRPPSMTLLLGFGGMGGLFTLIGLAMMSSSIMGIVNTSRLRLGGQVARGIVFKKWTDTDSDGDTIYFVAYAFKAEILGKGVQHISRAEQNKKLYDNVPVGGVLMVRYLPDNPQICRVDTKP